jgi:hypothetical protein
MYKATSSYLRRRADSGHRIPGDGSGKRTERSPEARDAEMRRLRHGIREAAALGRLNAVYWSDVVTAFRWVKWTCSRCGRLHEENLQAATWPRTGPRALLLAVLTRRAQACCEQSKAALVHLGQRRSSRAKVPGRQRRGRILKLYPIGSESAT